MSNLFLFFKNESSATAVRPCLIAAIIAITLITAANTIGGSLNEKLMSVASRFAD